MIVERPPFCPRCQTPELIGRAFSIGTVSTLSYTCPRCGWKLEGLAPKKIDVGKAQLTMIDDLSTMTSDMWKKLDQPAYRFKLTDNGADPLNMRDGT